MPVTTKKYKKNPYQSLLTGRMFSGKAVPSSTEDPDILNEVSGDDSGELIDNDLTETVTKLPADPTLRKPNWARRILSKGGAMNDYDNYRNQLEMQKYNFQLQQLIGAGKFDAARQLAEEKGKRDLIAEETRSTNTRKESKVDALAKQGVIMADDDAAINAYNQPGSGLDATLTGFKTKALEGGIKNELLATPSGAAEMRESLVQGYRKGGIDNKATSATTAQTEVNTRLAPYIKMGTGDALVNAFNTGMSFQNIPSRVEENLDMKTGFTTKNHIPGEVVGINAQDGTRVTIRPLPDVRPTITGNQLTNPVVANGAITQPPASSVVPMQADNKDVEFFDLLIKRLRDQMGRQPKVNF